MKYLILILSLCLCLGLTNAASALNIYYDKEVYDNTKGYDNKQGYDNKSGYENKIGYNNKTSYRSFFKEHKPNPEVIKIQKTTKFGSVIQTEVPVHQTEENVEQKGLEN